MRLEIIFLTLNLNHGNGYCMGSNSFITIATHCKMLKKKKKLGYTTKSLNLEAMAWFIEVHMWIPHLTLILFGPCEVKVSNVWGKFCICATKV